MLATSVSDFSLPMPHPQPPDNRDRHTPTRGRELTFMAYWEVASEALRLANSHLVKQDISPLQLERSRG